MLSVWSGPNFVVWEWVKGHLKSGLRGKDFKVLKVFAVD